MIAAVAILVVGSALGAVSIVLHHAGVIDRWLARATVRRPRARRR